MKISKGQIIRHIGTPIEYMYFVNRGIISVIKTMNDGRSTEIRAIGVEGVTDPTALFGVDEAVFEKVVQIPGEALRIPHQILKREMGTEEAVRRCFERYSLFVIQQLAQTSACNRLHEIEERLCRWLLIAHDSALSDNFPLTHEFLAMMLGVQRAGVSIAANFLKRIGFIDYKHGHVTILNRKGLEDAACECYAFLQDEFSKLFGAPAPGQAHIR